MKTPPPSPLRSDYLYIKDVEWAESNEKSYIRYLVFELLVAKDHQMATKNSSKSHQIYREDAVWSNNDFLHILFFLSDS